MLDQNTDRSWWMIGAVIVGAGLIAAAKIAFPEVFDNVIDFFLSNIPNSI
ncbi:hypothetical protein NSQ61_19715 [Aeribacillus sp. FSL K6-1121]